MVNKPKQKDRHTTKREFLQVERNPEFDAALKIARQKLADVRGNVVSREVSIEEISQSHAVRTAIEWFAANYEVTEK